MSDQHEIVWETYTASWKAPTREDKIRLFEGSLDSACVYNDPMVKTQGWEELAENMENFHKQVPGGHFVTTYFATHNNKSIARWEMHNGNNEALMEGISYGEYNENGKLTAMTGFYEAT